MSKKRESKVLQIQIPALFLNKHWLLISLYLHKEWRDSMSQGGGEEWKMWHSLFVKWPFKIKELKSKYQGGAWGRNYRQHGCSMLQSSIGEAAQEAELKHTQKGHSFFI